MSKTEIGLFALVSIPYSLKVLWAPLVDRLPLPVLGRRLGRRRCWALLAQGLLLAGIVLMGSTDPAASLGATAALALLVAFASASQDIVIDAYRVEILEERQLAAGAATTVFGWRIGQVGAGALGLILADVLPWPVVFTLIAAMVGVGMATILLNPEPKVAGGGGRRRGPRPGARRSSNAAGTCRGGSPPPWPGSTRRRCSRSSSSSAGGTGSRSSPSSPSTSSATRCWR